MTATPLNKFKMTGTRIDSLVGYGLTEIVIPTEVTEIKEYAFQDTSHNSRIQRIIIPDSVTRIGAFSMRDCKSLEEVYLPSSVTRLEKYTFFHCPQLSNIVLPENLTYIGEYALCSCGLVNVVIPKAVTTIATAAFMSCERLVSVSIPGSVTNFGDSVFYKCNNLTIYTTQGSAAEAYAKKNNIPYKIVDEAIVSTTPTSRPKSNHSFDYVQKQTLPVPPILEQQPSFADTLREKTKTKQQLAEEKERRRESQIQSNVQNVVEKVKCDCGNLANRGIRKLSKNYNIYSYEASTILGGELRLCQKTSSLVKQALQKEGFKTVSTSLHRCISGHGYDLHIVVSW